MKAREWISRKKDFELKWQRDTGSDVQAEMCMEMGRHDTMISKPDS